MTFTLVPLLDLLYPGRHSPLVGRRRAALIISRVRLIAAVFGVLTPLWIPIDFMVFGPVLAGNICLMRIFASLAFAAIAFSYGHSQEIGAAHRALGLLLSIPTVFFLISEPILAEADLSGSAQGAIAAGYAFLPFVMVAGLSVFPITAVEGIVLSVPLLLANLVVAYFGFRLLSFASYLGALWLLLLLATVATLAGMSQLHFMIQLVGQAAHDGLTNAFSRRVGEELLECQFELAERNRMPLTVAFIDLDQFKSINDRFGHDQGDAVLCLAAGSLRRALRRADVLIRWGGEEFVVIMPNADLVGATAAIQRLREAGLGNRPDGTPLTASVGLAERIADACVGWVDLVDIADRRMYGAKRTGGNRIVSGEGGDAR